MRRFVRHPLPKCPVLSDEEYLCQKNGMVGLGAGSRSYTTGLHYSSGYSPDRQTASKILDQWKSRTPEEMRQIGYGFVLNRDESMRRWLLKTLFLSEGLDLSAFRKEFDAEILSIFPLLKTLENEGLITVTPEKLKLTPDGLELSDAIGPLFYSPDVLKLMDHADE
jgi:oxygen-independent coproporphyrinogen-3 oxidase